MNNKQSPSTNISELRGWLKTGSADNALTKIRSLLNTNKFSPEELALIGKMILPRIANQNNTIHVTLLGQCTTTWLGYHLAVHGLKHGQQLAIHDTEYDTVLQSLMELPENTTDFFVLIPWNQRILKQIRSTEKLPDEIIEQELKFWQQVWNLSLQKNGRIIQVGYDYTIAGALGFHCSAKHGGEIDTIREINSRIRQSLPNGTFFIDLETLSGIIGRKSFYNSRQYYWTKLPFSELGTTLLAERIENAINVMRTGSKKVLVLDLDNTLWGGVVGDLGAYDIELGESPEGEGYRDFQLYCKNLSKRGILLAVATKNDEVNAKEPFEVNPNMVLKLDDIVSFQAHWRPKSESMKTIARELNLGIDSLVFFDDNPAEREEVHQNAPEVAVVEVPEDAADYIFALENSLFFETLSITTADTERTQQYLNENKRKTFENSFTNLDDYLKSLEMVGKITPINDGNLQRVVQLLSKTNQFNVTTKRHDEQTIRRFLSNPQTIALTLELSDKFGEHGLIAVAIGLPHNAIDEQQFVNNSEIIKEGDLIIDTFLMSCRVLNRTAEHFLMNEIIEQAIQKRFKRIVGEYIPTAKNNMVKNLFLTFGFETNSVLENQQLFFLTVPTSVLKTFVNATLTVNKKELL
ncbi:MAG: HAD-IIIC family phosphatase [Planctomycetaceae bacterium]|jgi:FkbH-like protein|nr:HAD-IIIC family phosphatase [Planctomycetaceae bacterium]